MILFSSRTTNLLYYRMLEYAYLAEVPFSESRAGEVKDLGPACYELIEDDIRLIFLNGRGFNPYFALAEFCWFITGSNLVEPLSSYISDYAKFSDDGLILNGAYGYRLRHHFGIDQINLAIAALREDATSRRVALTMWDVTDLGSISYDVPCNTAVYLKVRDNRLHISITCRSNDIYLGVPYNILLFSLLQKYIANALNVEIGSQIHYADSLHLYKNNLKNTQLILCQNTPSGITEISTKFKKGWAHRFLQLPPDKGLAGESLADSLFTCLYNAYSLYKSGDITSAARCLNVEETGLSFSAYQWLKERQSFSSECSIAEFDKFRETLNMTDLLSSLETLKYESESDIQSYIDRILPQLETCYDELVAVFNNDKGLVKIDISEKRRNLAAICLSITYATIDPLNPYVRDVMVHKLGTVAANYDLTCRDLLFLSSFETRFRSIIKNNQL